MPVAAGVVLLHAALVSSCTTFATLPALPRSAGKGDRAGAPFSAAATQSWAAPASSLRRRTGGSIVGVGLPALAGLSAIAGKVAARSRCIRRVQSFDATTNFGPALDVYAAMFGIAAVMFLGLFAAPFALYFGKNQEDEDDEGEEDFLFEPEAQAQHIIFTAS
mmetsp:Transcript_71413/g.165154  ORF Transcript_71413/g.165154 Transcript_71413/m.165154 type:complete len:163 (+) Transcript_71413:1-489(+)